jgi:Arc/MetJ-type ribon-helix-helix transcriptional regulator
MRESLNRLADRETQRTGRPVSRSDVVRQALEAYVREHLPNAKI